MIIFLHCCCGEWTCWLRCMHGFCLKRYISKPMDNEWFLLKKSDGYVYPTFRHNTIVECCCWLKFLITIHGRPTAMHLIPKRALHGAVRVASVTVPRLVKKGVVWANFIKVGNLANGALNKTWCPLSTHPKHKPTKDQDSGRSWHTMAPLLNTPEKWLKSWNRSVRLANDFQHFWQDSGNKGFQKPVFSLCKEPRISTCPREYW